MNENGILARNISHYTQLADRHQADFANAAHGSAEKEKHRQLFVLAVGVHSALIRYKDALA